MSAYTINALTAPDDYSTASTIENVNINSIVIDVANSAIYWQLKTGYAGVGGVWESAETYMLPGSRPIQSDTPGEIVGIRIRAATPLAQIPAGSQQAVVTVRAD